MLLHVIQMKLLRPRECPGKLCGSSHEAIAFPSSPRISFSNLYCVLCVFFFIARCGKFGEDWIDELISCHQQDLFFFGLKNTTDHLKWDLDYDLHLRSCVYTGVICLKNAPATLVYVWMVWTVSVPFFRQQKKKKKKVLARESEYAWILLSEWVLCITGYLVHFIFRFGKTIFLTVIYVGLF